MVARRLALAFFIAAALFAHAQASSWNVTSRMAAIESLVNRGTFAIDASPLKPATNIATPDTTIPTSRRS